MNELTSAIVDTTRYPLLVLDAELRVESANQAFYTAFRVPPADTIGRRVYQLGNNQWDIPELRRLLEEILPTNSVFDDFQVTHNFNDIGTRTMLVNARRLHGAHPQPRIVLVFADITEQLRLAKDLKETTERASRYARSLIEAALDPLVTISAEGKITDVNEGSVKITGVAREKLIGTDFLDYFTEPEKAREGYKQVFDRGTVTDYPLTIRHKDGHLTDVLYNASVYRDTNGAVLGVFAAARDVTEQKKASQFEQTLKKELQNSNQTLAKMNELTSAIVDTTRYPLLVLDAELRVESANQAFYTAFRVPPADTIGRRVYQLGNNQWDIPELRRRLEEILPTNSVFDDFQVTHNFNDIGTRTMLVNARRLHGSPTQPRIVLVFADITEQNRIAKDLKGKSDELARSNAELDQFAAVASHDLQEPLRMISNYVKLLERRYASTFDDKAREYMGFVTSGADRMSAMIKAILAYSQLGHQGSGFAMTESDISLHGALANLKRKINEAKATITEGHLPQVMSNAEQLTQLFQNLLGNALKFRSNKRPPTVHVSAAESESEWTFAVADNGIGMEPEDFGRIFQLFQRLNTAQEYPGTGIGLATCKKIAEHHGGRIWVESQPDVGSTFYFTLPKSTAQSSRLGRQTTPAMVTTP